MWETRFLQIHAEKLYFSSGYSYKARVDRLRICFPKGLLPRYMTRRSGVRALKLTVRNSTASIRPCASNASFLFCKTVPPTACKVDRAEEKGAQSKSLKRVCRNVDLNKPDKLTAYRYFFSCTHDQYTQHGGRCIENGYIPRVLQHGDATLGGTPSPPRRLRFL